jgi:hypothetical protein
LGLSASSPSFSQSLLFFLNRKLKNGEEENREEENERTLREREKERRREEREKKNKQKLTGATVTFKYEGLL